MSNNRRTLLQSLGYGSASLGDSISYSFIGSYLLVFLTTVLHMKPALAGIITAAGCVWNALINPVIGWFCDRARSRSGRRRILILLASFPLAGSTLLLFVRLPLGGLGAFFWYAFLTMAFWTAYTCFLVPYLALGAAYTPDYDGRTRLRLAASQFNTVGSMLALAFPPSIRKLFLRLGASPAGSWSLTALVIAVLGFASLLVTFLSARRFDQTDRNAGLLGFDRSECRFSLPSLLREYFSIGSLRPVRSLLAASLCLLTGYEMYMADLVYLFTYDLGFSAGRSTFFLALRGIYGTGLLAVTAFAVRKLDKRNTLIAAYLASAAGMTLIRLTGLNSFPAQLLYMLMVALATCVYWQLIPSMYYDVADYDRLKTGKNRQAAVISFQGFLESAALGLGSLLLGLVLQLAGFQGALSEQAPATVLWIRNLATVVPLVFTGLGILALWTYPIDRAAHQRILLDLKNRDAGEQHPADRQL